MKSSLFKKSLILGVMFHICSIAAISQVSSRIQRIAVTKLKSWNNPLTEWNHVGKLKTDSIAINRLAEKISLYFSPTLSYCPIREENAALFIKSLRKSLGNRFKKYDLQVYSNGYSLYQLIPNYYRKDTPVDSTRIGLTKEWKPVLVRNINGYIPAKGLSSNSLALWHSHGYYFEMSLDRWEWQRARLFGTVEDISVMGYVLPYLTKMLENAGANVFLPRERDTQIHEVIVDNDRSTGNSEVVLHLKNNSQKVNEGFLLSDTLFQGINPFKQGTSLRIINDSAVYIPEIPADGDYAIYVSYPLLSDNSPEVKYTVSHTGGKTEYIVNQTIGGETWIYLGTFFFRAGKSFKSGSLLVSGITGNSYIGIDAVRLGGGMGTVARRPSQEIIKNQRSVSDNSPVNTLPDEFISTEFSWKLSGKPRYLEASRYYLQYAGMPDTLVYSPNTNKNDYNDDYQSRGLWVNYLTAEPFTKLSSKKSGGLGIPIDLSLAFHTDANVTSDDSIIGTLAIYSTGADNGKFPDGTSRMASRDLSDIIQTQVVDDIKRIYNPAWTRRGIWDRPYSEARRPNVPAMLLELLSHQNLADQRFGLDPRFRWWVSRSIYKGILRYLSYTENREYIVQPVPVTNFAISPLGNKRIRLSWEPVTDSLESTSKPDRYMVYKRIGENGFGNGVIVNNPWTEIEIESYDTIYSFKVTALNEGGESFESEILSVGFKEQDTIGVLVVNGFDRISGPETFDTGKIAGVAWWKDRGVADRFEISTVGDQYDFDRGSAWLDDDSPGWGASYPDLEGKKIPGNNFDYSYIHGKAILAAGRTFFSVSDEYFSSDNFNISAYKVVDMIFGEEKSTTSLKDTSVVDFKIYTPNLMKRIKELTQSGANIFISGAYVGTDLLPAGDSTAIKFASMYLHFKPRTGHAVNNGEVYVTDYGKQVFSGDLKFNTGFSENMYSVEAPDAIEPEGKGAICALRYRANNTSAGVVFKGNNKTVVLGFPFETILVENERNFLMKQIINFFEK